MSPPGPGKLAGKAAHPVQHGPWHHSYRAVLHSCDPLPPFSLPCAGHNLLRECPGHGHHQSCTELAELLKDPGGERRRSKQVSQPKPASQGGAGGLTAEELRLSQLASSQGSRASQSDARQAAQASGPQVSNLRRFFSIFTIIRLRRKPLIRCWWRPQDAQTLSGGRQRGT